MVRSIALIMIVILTGTAACGEILVHAEPLRSMGNSVGGPQDMKTSTNDRSRMTDRKEDLQLAQATKESQASTSENQGGEQRFDVQRFRVEGTVLLSEEEIQAILEPHKGPNKSIKDIEKAKQVLEDAFHSRGYSSILVTVPEQTIE